MNTNVELPARSTHFSISIDLAMTYIQLVSYFMRHWPKDNIERLQDIWHRSVWPSFMWILNVCFILYSNVNMIRDNTNSLIEHSPTSITNYRADVMIIRTWSFFRVIRVSCHRRQPTLTIDFMYAHVNLSNIWHIRIICLRMNWSVDIEHD
jgi:hypothetical protein